MLDRRRRWQLVSFGGGAVGFHKPAQLTICFLMYAGCWLFFSL